MESNRENTDLPARSGVFMHSFSPGTEIRGGGLFTFVLMAFGFLFFVLMALFALIGGSFSVLLGRPRKINLDYNLQGGGGMFGGDAFARSEDGVIDITATEIKEKKIEGE